MPVEKPLPQTVSISSGFSGYLFRSHE